MDDILRRSLRCRTMMKKTRLRTKSASERSEPGRRLVNANNLRRRVDLSGLSRKERDAFYAGAKFDTVPANAVIPTPPTKWIMQEGTRSQSSPSSPITVSGKPVSVSSVTPSASLPIKLDIESLFGTNRPASTDFSDSKLGRLLKSATAPATVPQRPISTNQHHLNGISACVTNNSPPLKRIVPMKPLESVVVAQQPLVPPTPKSRSTSELMKQVSGISGKDLMGLLKADRQQYRESERERPSSVNKLVSPSCQFEFDHLDSVDTQYKDITNHLKSILKVTITAA